MLEEKTIRDMYETGLNSLVMRMAVEGVKDLDSEVGMQTALLLSSQTALAVVLQAPLRDDIKRALKLVGPAAEIAKLCREQLEKEAKDDEIPG